MYTNEAMHRMYMYTCRSSCVYNKEANYSACVVGLT